MEPDTIVAIATAPGHGAIAVVRLSGQSAFTIAERLAPGITVPLQTRRSRLLELIDPLDGTPLDRALVTAFSAPGSYTGEDVVEFSTHGGSMVPALVLDAAVTLGARQAEAGEFTRRAYLNGRLDLVQAEAVLDLIEARSRAFHRAAIQNLDAGFVARLNRFREGVVHLEALLVHHLDFPDEDDAPVPLSQIIEEAAALECDLSQLVSTAPEGEMLRLGARIVFAGRPNVGKSSLFNALLCEERAIVAATPGTTRDVIEAHLDLGGYPVRLFDTAGLRESEDEIERLGVAMTHRQLADADLVLLCVDGVRPFDTEELDFLSQENLGEVLVVRTKADLFEDRGGGGDGIGLRESIGERAVEEIQVSVVSGAGLARLRERIPAMIFSGLVSGGGAGGVLTRPRQTREARRALGELTAFGVALRGGVPAEVASAHLRSAETALEDLVGIIGSEEVLDRVFRDFCIGK